MTKGRHKKSLKKKPITVSLDMSAINIIDELIRKNMKSRSSKLNYIIHQFNINNILKKGEKINAIKITKSQRFQKTHVRQD